MCPSYAAIGCGLYSCLRCATASDDPSPSPTLPPATSPDTALLLSSATYPGLICNRHAFSQSFGLPPLKPLPCPTVACLLFATAGADAAPPIGNVLVWGPSSNWNCTSAFGPNRNPTPSFESVPVKKCKIIYSSVKISGYSSEKRVGMVKLSSKKEIKKHYKYYALYMIMFLLPILFLQIKSTN